MPRRRRPVQRITVRDAWATRRYHGPIFELQGRAVLNGTFADPVRWIAKVRRSYFVCVDWENRLPREIRPDALVSVSLDPPGYTRPIA